MKFLKSGCHRSIQSPVFACLSSKWKSRGRTPVFLFFCLSPSQVQKRWIALQGGSISLLSQETKSAARSSSPENAFYLIWAQEQKKSSTRAITVSLFKSASFSCVELTVVQDSNSRACSSKCTCVVRVGHTFCVNYNNMCREAKLSLTLLSD